MVKAYRVFYEKSGKNDNNFVLVGEGETVEEALSKKDSYFSVDSRWCRITSKQEIPLSNVKILHLSIAEFLMISK